MVILKNLLLSGEKKKVQLFVLHPTIHIIFYLDKFYSIYSFITHYILKSDTYMV